MRCTCCLVCLSWGKILLYAHRRAREESFLNARSDKVPTRQALTTPGRVFYYCRSSSSLLVLLDIALHGRQEDL